MSVFLGGHKENDLAIKYTALTAVMKMKWNKTDQTFDTPGEMYQRMFCEEKIKNQLMVLSSKKNLGC